MNREYLPRNDLRTSIDASLRENPVTAVLGPRQCGKTTLARTFVTQPDNYFDVEGPVDLAKLDPDPHGLLASRSGVVVLDEIQLMPELLSSLRVLVDDPRNTSRFLITGSASPELAGAAAETLAGRIHFIEMSGLSLVETGAASWRELWLRGGFPRSYLAGDDPRSAVWRTDFIKTYVMRDIERMARGGLAPVRLARLLSLLAHYHGQFWNRNEVAETLGVDVKTIQRYVDIMEGAYLLRLIHPHEINLKRRLRKSPKMYIRDTGLLHTLLRIEDPDRLGSHDRRGASFEGFVVEQVASMLPGDVPLSVFSPHVGAEIDLVIPGPGGLLGLEVKASTAPRLPKGIETSCRDLDLSRLVVVHQGNQASENDGVIYLPVQRLGELASYLPR